jgi:hypothetical protein
MNRVKAFEIDASAIHQVESPGFDDQIVEQTDLVSMSRPE